MFRSADAPRCPSCTARLEPDTEACQSCSLPLRGPLAHELFLTLTKADQLLTALRATVTPAVPQAGVTVTSPARPPRRRALSGASVPQLLLGLGALCLLVAALVFLAVTWSVMGVGGRTVTLVGLTVVSAAITAVVSRRGLRGATEALGLVTLGFVGLDIAGADHAGWFGDLGTASFLVVLGAVLLVAATAACLAVRRTPASSFLGGEVVVGLGWCLVAAGLDLGEAPTSAASAVLATLLTAAGAVAAHRLRLQLATPVVAAVTGLAWLELVTVGLDGVADELTVAHVWGELAAWPLVAAAAFLGVAAVVLRSTPSAAGVAQSVAVALLAGTVLSPALDNGSTPATLAVLTALAVALAVLWWLPRWAAAAGLPALLGSVVAAGQSVVLVGAAVERLDRALALAGSVGGRLPAAQVTEGLQPWLLLPDLALTLVALLVVRRLLPSSVPARPVVVVAALVAATATAALYPVPVWTIVAGLLLAGVALLVADDLVLGAVALGGGLVVATYSDGLTALALTVVLASSAWLHARDRRDLVAAAAGAVAATSLAASVWTWGDLLDRPGAWTAAVGIVGVACVALLRSRSGVRAGGVRGGVGVEIGAAAGIAGLAAAGLSVVAVVAVEETSTWLAVYLTLAGAAASAAALLRTDRRQLGWAGGVLLTAASWVRLADVGVTDPEPYTLPAALALLVTGVVQLRRRTEEDTVRALGPGLGLALLPSLLWVLDDPATLRSLLLGVACLGLVIVGLRLRWTAPLVAGALVGAAIVLRSAAPYVGEAVPRWGTIGTAGVLLVALGITWEQRVREARTVVGYVRQLR